MTPVAHLDVSTGPRVGRGPASAPSFLPSRHALWDQGPHCGCLPSPPTPQLHACPPTHPSVCPLLTSVSTLCHPGWLGAGLQASWEECGRPAGSSLPGRQPQGPARPRPLRVCLQSWAGPLARLRG